MRPRRDSHRMTVQHTVRPPAMVVPTTARTQLSSEMPGAWRGKPSENMVASLDKRCGSSGEQVHPSTSHCSKPGLPLLPDRNRKSPLSDESDSTKPMRIPPQVFTSKSDIDGDCVDIKFQPVAEHAASSLPPLLPQSSDNRIPPPPPMDEHMLCTPPPTSGTPEVQSPAALSQECEPLLQSHLPADSIANDALQVGDMASRVHQEAFIGLEEGPESSVAEVGQLELENSPPLRSVAASVPVEAENVAFPHAGPSSSLWHDPGEEECEWGNETQFLADCAVAAAFANSHITSPPGTKLVSTGHMTSALKTVHRHVA